MICYDVTTLGLGLWASFSLRLDRWVPPQDMEALLAILAGPAVAVPIFIRMGLYRAVVRYLPERALWTMLRAVTLAVLMWMVAIFLSQFLVNQVVPRSVPIVYWALACITVIGSRFAAKRAFGVGLSASDKDRSAIVIYGAGEAGTQLAMSLRSTHLVVGFLDDNPNLHHREVAGARVYPPSQLDGLIADYGVEQVILGMPGITTPRRKEIAADLTSKGVRVRSLPTMADLVTGNYLVNQVRELEIDDLLGRSTVPPDQDLIRSMIVGRSIMVTGAGGSIGSELCRRIAHWRPQRLVLFEANEFALYRIEHELRASEIPVVPVLASVAMKSDVERAITANGVEVIFHAAAHKHVPLLEANAMEAIRNNVFGTSTIVQAALDSGVDDFVLISTDKAVRPTNVMGATKRWAELIVQKAASQVASQGSTKRFCAVRFGNVLGSNGSVVPLFQEQIKRGGPVTLTDLRMTRYFMSIQEAAELIVQAGALSAGGDVFLLDMGEPILISDLAKNMIQLAGLSVRSASNPKGDIEIVVTGKRPGEKMYEELFYDSSKAVRTRHPKILSSSNTTIDSLDEYMADLEQALSAADEVAARHVLFELVSKSERQLA